MSIDQAINHGLTGRRTPRFAVSTGIATIMDARQVVSAVQGERKENMLWSVFTAEEPKKDLPATVLQQHPNHLWIVAASAARRIKPLLRAG